MSRVGCEYCTTSFKNRRYLLQHQARSKICIKYRDALFCCERCGTFKTKGINNFNAHLESCVGSTTCIPIPNKNQTNIVKELQSKLEAERIRSNIYLALLSSNTNLNVSQLVKQKDKCLHLFNIDNQTKIIIHDRISNDRIKQGNIPLSRPVDDASQKQQVNIPLSRPVDSSRKQQGNIPLSKPVDASQKQQGNIPLSKPVDASQKQQVNIPLSRPVDSSQKQQVNIPLSRPVDSSQKQQVNIPLSKPVDASQKQQGNIPLSKPVDASQKQQSVVRRYRRAPRDVEISPEPTTDVRSIAINKIDKRSKETLNKLNDDRVKNINQTCKDLIDQLASSRVYTKLLRKLKTKRITLLGTLKLDEYTLLVQDHTLQLTDIFKKKQQSNTRMRTNINNSLTPIDSRLLKYPGYHETQMDGECRERLEAVIRHGRIFSKEFKPHDLKYISDKLTNYSVSIFPMEKLIRWALINPYGFWNVVYLPWPKSSLDDPYSFYVLDKIKKGKRYWNMNCRLEDFSTDLAYSVQPYLIKLFRELYYTVFNDNCYRPNASDLSSFISEDCEQLAQNIILMSQPRKLCCKLRKIIISECTYNHTDQDHFSLLGDDVLQRKRFKHKEKIEMVSTIKKLFDQITDEQAVKFYKCRNVA